MIWHETRYRRVTRSGWAGKCRYARRWWEETSILEALLRPWGHLQRTPLCCPVANQRSSCVCRVYVLCCYWERKKTFSLWIICPNCLHNSERICLQRSLVTGMYWKIFSFTPRPVSFFFFVFVHTIASQVVIRFDDTFRSSNIDKVLWLWEEKASQVNLQSLPRLFVCRPVPPLNVHIELRVCFCLNRPHLSLDRCCVSDILNLFLPHNTWTAAWKKRG